MEGTMSEIRAFGGTFAPAGWMFCAGQSMPIAQYDALYALLGTTYGGDGQTTFNLPDLQGRVPVGIGQGPALQNIDLGEVSGSEGVTLTSQQLPAHNHATTVTAAASFAPKVLNAPATTDSPSGNYVAQVPGNQRFATTHDGSVAVTTFSGTGTAILSPIGGSQPHDNIMPVTACYWIICVEGIFPSRN
ncbi:MAG: tail fiber protein [Bacteroidota bacterium]